MTHVIPLKGGWSIELACEGGIDPASITLCKGDVSLFVPITRAESWKTLDSCIRAQQEGEPLTNGDVD